jgi:hypothetical protein
MRTLVLNSSQPKHPVGSDPWVRATLAAVDSAIVHGHEIVTSVGMASWELSLWRSAAHGARTHVVCPIRPGQEEPACAAAWSTAFGLPEDLVCWHWVTNAGRSPKAAWPIRDRAAIALSDLVLPVSVRPCGRLAGLVRERGIASSASFSVAWVRAARPARWEQRIPTARADLWQPGSLVHLTRSCNGPWPGELHRHYYEDVVASTEAYARSGFATLRRILQEGRIRGSGFRARGGQARVCLSACASREALGLVRFRARYARYSFEPYAVVLSPRAAVRLGARPVTYGSGDDPFAQGAGTEDHWRREQEWRVLGDVDLRSVDASDVLVVTATEREADELRGSSAYEVKSFGCRDP